MRVEGNIYKQQFLYDAQEHFEPITKTFKGTSEQLFDATQSGTSASPEKVVVVRKRRVEFQKKYQVLCDAAGQIASRKTNVAERQDDVDEDKANVESE